MKIKADYANSPVWKEFNVKSTLPEELQCLDELAHNMWWVWNYDAREMWRSLDEDLYEQVAHNPVMLLDRLSYERKEEIVKDKAIMKNVKEVYNHFRSYMDVKPNENRPSVAYFSMEFGIHNSLKIYSGGLGMLAGDYIKEASDSNVDMCGIGFLYRFGYFKQTLSMDGQQIANYDAQNFTSLPITRTLDENGNQVVVDVPYMNYMVHALVWQANVGRVKLYLLDTDNDMNSDYDRPITHALYGGDWENRLKQEILLGIGGILTLKLFARMMRAEISADEAVSRYIYWFYKDFDRHTSCSASFFRKLQSETLVDYSKHIAKYAPEPVGCKVNADTYLLRLPSCNGVVPTWEWLNKKADEFKQSGCKYLILDLRGNGGGSDHYSELFTKIFWFDWFETRGTFLYSKQF